MARRAQFGQAPRVQPSLTSTLVAIAREMQAKRDQNIMDAWKNGGKFEGKDATDEAVLAYWKARMANLDPSDPNYNAYQNQVMQLQYSIEQSKADLAHLQGKLSDTAYASFFLKWARKVPKNSEFWRVLQKDAAQLIEQAKNKSAASADKAKTDAFNKFVSSRQDDINLGNALTDAITKISKETGLSVTDHGDELLSILSRDYAANPDEYRALQDSLKGTGFDGTFTSSFVASSFNAARVAYRDVATRANKDGYASAYDSASKGQSSMSDWGQNLNVWPVAQSYDKAYENMTDVLNNPNASWSEKNAAQMQFAAVAESLARTPGIDAGSVAMLTADAARARGQDAGDTPSFGAAMLGHTGVTVDMQNNSVAWTAAETAMRDNPGAFVYAPVDSKGQFDPTGKGGVGIVAAGDVPSDAVYVPVPGLDGQSRMVAVKPWDIYMKDPANPDGDPILIGHGLSYNSGGQQITLYNYNDGDKVGHWSPTSPLADNVSTERDKAGNLVVTPAGYGDPLSQAKAFDEKNGTNLADQMSGVFGPDGKPIPGAKADASVEVRDANGKVTGVMKVSWTGTGFSATQSTYGYDAEGKRIETGSTTIPFGVNDPDALYRATIAGSRLQAGNIPGVTFDSAVAASVAAASNKANAGSQMAALAQNPDFQHAFLVQTMSSFGTDNPLDPRVVEAWNKVTAPATGPHTTAFEQNHRIGPGNAYDRTDVTLPGQKPADPTKTDLTINFGGQDLKVPGVPAYLKSVAPTGTLGTDALKNNPAFAASVRGYLPVYGPPAPTTKPATSTSTSTSVTTTVTPTGSPTPGTSVSGPAPSGSPAPSPTPSPSPSPSPSPVPSGSPSPKPY